MHLTLVTLLIASLYSVCLAQTFVITCIGPKCDSNPTPTTITSLPGPITVTVTKTIITTPQSASSKRSSTTLKSSKTTLLSSTKPAPKPSKTTSEEIGPSSTACPVPVYYQCGGYYDSVPWSGCTTCVKGAKCVVQNGFYHQCVMDTGN
ncbi:hypothetical protein ACN47E_007829 [Coniothyrium glycines]